MTISRLNPVRIIGAGFSGLTAAYYLAKQGVAVEVYEKSDRPGGVLGSERLSWGLVESAANGLMGDDRVAELFKDLQVQSAERSRESFARYIFRDGRPQKWPLTLGETWVFLVGLFRFLFSMFSPNSEFNAQSRSNHKRLPGAAPFRYDPLTETLDSWVTRHFGRATYDSLFGAALRGIYGSNDLNASLIINPLIIRGGKKIKGRKKHGGIMAPEGGMQELVTALEKKITELGGRIFYNTEGEVQSGRVNVIATPAPVASLLLAEHAPTAAQILSRVAYLPITTVTVGFDSQAKRLPGFGCLFAPKENMNALGALFNNYIFNNRSPEHTETWMFNHTDDSDDELLHKISQDRQRLVRSHDKIHHSKITRWPHALPHYNNALAEALHELNQDDLAKEHIFLTGNYLGKIGLAKILDQNEKLAQKIKEIL